MRKKRFPNDDDEPWYKHRWAWFVWIGPLVSVIVSFSLLFVAIKNADTIVDQDYYKSGQKRLTDTSKQKRAIELGYSGELLFSPNRKMLLLNFKSGTAPKVLYLKFQHPTVPDWDLSVDLHEESPGIYRGVVNLRKAEHWYLILSDHDHTWEIKANWLERYDRIVLDPKLSHF